MPDRALNTASAYLRQGLLLLTCLPVACAVGGATWNEGSGCRWLEIEPVSGSKAGFTLLSPAQTGVEFTNLLSADRSITNHVLLNGSGVAAGDVDGDGWVDLYFCGLDSANQLYRNRGQWRFEDVTQAAGVACPDLDATGAAFADLDGDGDLDLVVNSIAGGAHLFLNDGRGHFAPAPRSPVLNQNQAGTSLALSDMDGDGGLDLYVANYRPMFFFQDKPETRYSIRMVEGQPTVAMIDGRPLTDPEFTNRFVFQLHMSDGKVTLGKEELGQVDALYRNDGHGGFQRVPFTSGAFVDEDGKPLAQPPRDWGLSVMFRDLNGDGFPDLYVCNDFRTPDRVWLNDGHGRFRALPRLGIRETCLSAMAMDVADVNRDGFFDIFVADMLSTEHRKRLTQRIDLRPESLQPGQIDNRPQFSRNMLQLSRGDGTYAEIAQLCGLEASDWTWSPIFLDVDLDGYEDLIVANGFERDTMNVDAQRQFDATSQRQGLKGLARLKLRKMYPRLATPNLAFRNQGDGTFTNVSAAWGFDTPALSQGMCLADLDHDGDLDVIVNNMNEPAGLYRNNTAAPRLAVRLKGMPPNTRGIGARIEVLGGPVYQSQEMICGGRYCSSDDPMRVFAAGSATHGLKIVVTWRSGKRSVIESAKGNRVYEIEERAATAQPPPVPSPIADRQPWLAASDSTAEAPRASTPNPFFRDVSDRLGHTHRQEPFDDFSRQRLLPVKLSQLGPGVAWFDVDLDGREDLVIAGGRGVAPAVYRNVGNGAFEPFTPGFPAPTRDQGAVVGWHPHADAARFLIAESSYVDGDPNRPAVHEFDCKSKTAHPLIPGDRPTVGPIALADIDGDGDLDLFVGGRVVPARYPEPASSRLYRNEDGRFRPDLANWKALENLGLISGAVFSDLDSDGFPELVLSCEWGPVRVFSNARGVFTEATQRLGLANATGWWNGVATGDFDEDGRLDMVASNWGRNSRYETFRAQPLRIYYGDFNGDGGVQLIEAHYEPQLKKNVPFRRLDDMAKTMPFLDANYSTFAEFSEAGVEEILGDRLAKAIVVQASQLETCIFLNRGDHFETRVLPLEAQLAPAFAVCVADLDGDGHDDIFLGQNFFGVPLEVSRYDAGRGLWLRGDGHGGFDHVSGPRSGLLIYGEQRGAALCDYDADGRVDLVVTQNGAQTRLFHNEGAQPGLRVRVQGLAGNRDGIGAVLQLKSADRAGAAREIHAGSGYWSQDSPVLVLTLPGSPTELIARWPGGRSSTFALPNGAREVKIEPSGKLALVR